MFLTYFEKIYFYLDTIIKFIRHKNFRLLSRKKRFYIKFLTYIPKTFDNLLFLIYSKVRKKEINYV